jgi:hypothetical protein
MFVQFNYPVFILPKKRTNEQSKIFFYTPRTKAVSGAGKCPARPAAAGRAYFI